MTVAEDDDTLVARGNLAEDACRGAGDEEGGGCGAMKCGGLPLGALRFFCGRNGDDRADTGEDEDEDGPSRRSRRRKVKERRSEGLQRGQEENQATGAPCVTVHLHMVVELGELWRCSGAGAC